MADRTTKALLLVIAVGLWMNLASAWTQPVPVIAAQSSARSVIDFIDYWQLAEEKREQGETVDDIQVLLLAHIAGNTRGVSR